MSESPAKHCVVCGRRFEWRRRWQRDWDAVRHCSDACRRRGLDDTDRALEQAIRGLLAKRAKDATLCPSEAAKAVGGDDWRTLMEPARAAARRLVAAGEASILQRGRVVDASTARGAIRIGRARTVAPPVPATRVKPGR